MDRMSEDRLDEFEPIGVGRNEGRPVPVRRNGHDRCEHKGIDVPDTLVRAPFALTNFSAIFFDPLTKL